MRAQLSQVPNIRAGRVEWRKGPQNYTTPHKRCTCSSPSRAGAARSHTFQCRADISYIYYCARWFAFIGFVCCAERAQIFSHALHSTCAKRRDDFSCRLNYSPRCVSRMRRRDDQVLRVHLFTTLLSYTHGRTTINGINCNVPTTWSTRCVGRFWFGGEASI